MTSPTLWSTPQPIFDAINRHFNFAVDLCADPDNAKCSAWLNRDLNQDWGGEGVGWLNPPFGREIGLWLNKVVNTQRIIVVCLPARTNPPWWHDYVMQAQEIRFLRKKVTFANGNGCKGVPPWGVAIAVFYPFGAPGFYGRDREWPLCRSWDWRQPW